MKNPNLTERHLFPNKVNVNLDVLRTAMLNRVASHVNSADIITENDCSGVKGTLEFLEKLAKPTTLSHDMSHGAVLCFGARTRYRGLAFG